MALHNFYHRNLQTFKILYLNYEERISSAQNVLTYK